MNYLIIPARHVVCIILGIAGWIAVAEPLDIHPLSLPHDMLSRVRGRLFEACLIWLVACSATGWIRRARGKRASQGARVWPLAVPLILCGMVGSILFWIDSQNLWQLRSRWVVITVIVMTAMPMVAAVVAALYLKYQARFWKALADPSAICPVCGYDLQGNRSGRCPECGTQVEDDPNIPRMFFATKRSWFYPELSEFPTAAARYAAWRKALREVRWSNPADILMLLAVLGFAAFRLVRPLDDNKLLFLGIPLAILYVLSFRRRMRRRLRRYLANSSNDQPNLS